MSFKLVASQVISESNISRIVNRTYCSPSYCCSKRAQSRQDLRFSSQSPCCCSSTNGPAYQMSIRCYSANRIRAERSASGSGNVEGVNSTAPVMQQYFNLIDGRAKKVEPLFKRYESCYRPLYPTKPGNYASLKSTRKSFNLKPKQPMKKTHLNSYQSYDTIEKSVYSLSRWPPLYKCKNKGNRRQNKTSETAIADQLPAWLLPLYSFKSGKPGSKNKLTDPRFSGESFRRKMEIHQCIKEIRLKQKIIKEKLIDQAAKETNEEPSTSKGDHKPSTAVEELKGKIREMRRKFYPIKPSSSSKRDKERQSTNISDQLAEKKSTVESSEPPKTEETIFNAKLDTAAHNHQPPKNSKSTVWNVKPSTSLEKKPAANTSEINGSTSNNGKVDFENERLEWNVGTLRNRISEMRLTGTEKSSNNVDLTRNKIRLNLIEPVGKRITKDVKKGELDNVGGNTASNFPTNPTVVEGIPMKSLHGLSYLGKRQFSTLSARGSQIPTKLSSNVITARRRITGGYPLSRKSFFTRVKRFFIIKHSSVPRFKNWKLTPRVDRNALVQTDLVHSPSPLLWGSKDQALIRNPVLVIERSHPAVANAERRIMAKLSRMVPVVAATVKSELESADPSTSPNNPENDTRLSEVREKIKRAESKVNNSPFLAIIKSDNNLCPQLVDNDKTSMTGYDWISNNRHTVEDMKRKSREPTEKPLVPAHVKQEIEDFRIPLKARIAEYRNRVENKCAPGLSAFTVSKRLFSSCNSNDVVVRSYHSCVVSMCGGAPKFLVGSTLLESNKRYMSTRTINPDVSNRLRSTQKNAMAGFNSTDRVNRHPLSSEFGKTSPKTSATKYKRTLTSPSKTSQFKRNRPGDSLKRQVEDLKRLIETVKGSNNSEKVKKDGEFLRSGNDYQLKLTNLVNNVHTSVKRIEIKPPIGENIVNSGTSVQHEGGCENIGHGMNRNQKLAEDSGNVQTKSDPVLQGSVHTFHNTNHPFAVVYKRFLKRFLETATPKSTLVDNNNKAGNVFRPNVFGTQFKMMADRKKQLQNVISSKQTQLRQMKKNPIFVKLHAKHTAAPSDRVQLWRNRTRAQTSPSSQIRPKKIEIEAGYKAGSERSPTTYRELQTLLDRAKELLSFLSQPANVSKIINKKEDQANKRAITSIRLDDELAKKVTRSDAPVLRPKDLVISGKGEFLNNVTREMETVGHNYGTIGSKDESVSQPGWNTPKCNPELVQSPRNEAQQQLSRSVAVEVTPNCREVPPLQKPLAISVPRSPEPAETISKAHQDLPPPELPFLPNEPRELKSCPMTEICEHPSMNPVWKCGVDKFEEMVTPAPQQVPSPTEVVAMRPHPVHQETRHCTVSYFNPPNFNETPTISETMQRTNLTDELPSDDCQLNHKNSYYRFQNHHDTPHEPSYELDRTAPPTLEKPTVTCRQNVNCSYSNNRTTTENPTVFNKNCDELTYGALLKRDPRINLEVVKRLKLPTSSSECSSEKTWFYNN